MFEQQRLDREMERGVREEKSISCMSGDLGLIFQQISFCLPVIIIITHNQPKTKCTCVTFNPTSQEDASDPRHLPVKQTMMMTMASYEVGDLGEGAGKPLY